jgi:hypothetical protein
MQLCYKKQSINAIQEKVHCTIKMHSSFMFEHVVLLSFKGLMITWCELLGGKSGLYAG